jgi:Flp pilus assembly protein TadD
MRALRLGLALLGLCMPACAALRALPGAFPGESLDGWHAVEGDGFRLLGDLPPDALRGRADDLARFDRVFARLVRSPGSPAAPVSIFLLRDPELARRFVLRHRVASWSLATLDACFAAVPAQGSSGETRLALFHEYARTLLRRGRRAPLPPWYDEGLSDYFAMQNFRDGAVVVGSVPEGTIEWLAHRGTIPLQRLFEASAREGRPDARRGFRATAWALAHHLLASPGGRRELARFVEELERGAEWRVAFASAFDRPIGRLEAELAAHVALLARGVAVESVFDVRDLGAPPHGEVVPLPAPEAGYELGRLALELRGGTQDGSLVPLARTLLAAAVEGGAGARAEAALAEALASGGDVEAGLARIERARALDPDDPRVWLHAGRVELAAAESFRHGSRDATARALIGAERAYARALALDPGLAGAWEGLGRARRWSGRGDEALAALERARELAWSASLDLELGGLYLERGRSEAAFALLRPLARDPHGGRVAARARELVARAEILAAGASRAR